MLRYSLMPIHIEYLSKTPSLKGLGIFINEDHILEDHTELRKEVQNVKESRNEGKWAMTRNIKGIIRDKDTKITINRDFDAPSALLELLWLSKEQRSHVKLDP